MNIEPIVEAAKQAGNLIKNYFGDSLVVEEKSTVSDLRTKADTEAEDIILEILKREYPTYNILTEESGYIDNKSEYTFIIDPLDGSTNFVMGIPYFSVSIALFHNDEAIVGVVYQPLIDQLYTAEKGKGAYLNRKKLAVNKESDIKKTTIFYSNGYVYSYEFIENLFHKFNNLPIKRYFTSWSPAFDLCLVAAGKIEVMISNKNDIYDYSAGVLIAKEAGAHITTFLGETNINDRNDTFVASNGTIVHQQILDLLKGS